MAAATQAGQTLYSASGLPVFRVRFSAMTSDQIETLSYNYTSLPAAAPYSVEMNIATFPTQRCLVGMECDYTAANTTNKTIPVRFIVPAGCDITGAVCDVYLYFLGAGMVAQTSP